MKIIKVFPLVLLLLLTGCQLFGPSVRVSGPSVIVDGNNGTHCPPGQAKKGKC